MGNKIKSCICILCAVMTVCMSAGCEKKESSAELVTMSMTSLSYGTIYYDFPDDVILSSSMGAGDGMFFTLNKKKTADSLSFVLTAFDENMVIYETRLPAPDNDCTCNMFVHPDNTVSVMITEGSIGIISTVAPDGTVINEVDISAGLGGKSGNEFVVTSDGKYAVDAGHGCLVMLNADGTPMYEATAKNVPAALIGSDVILNHNGDPVLVCSYTDSAEFVTEVFTLNRDEKKFKKRTRLKDHTVFGGYGDYIYCTASETGISGIREDGRSEHIINLLNLGIDSSTIHSINTFDDGSLILGLYDVFDMSNNGFVKVAPADGADIKEKTVITLGAFKVPVTVKSQISNFNRRNDDYVVVVSSFAENIDEDDETAALIEFNKQLIMGNIPDIVVINQEMPFDGYVRKGLFTDLYPYLDNDSDVSRDSFFESVLRQGEHDGKLYSMIPSFNIKTYVANKAVIGGETLLTTDMSQRLINEMGDGAVVTNELSRSEALKEAILFSGVIDFENGTSSFDSDEFRALLTEIKKLPETPASYDPGSVEYRDSQLSYRNGKTLVKRLNLFGFLSCFQPKVIAGDDAVFINFPTCMPEANCMLSSYNALAISESSQNKEAAWEFVKYAMTHNVSLFPYSYYDKDGNEIFTDDNMAYALGGFTTFKDEYELMAEDAMKPWRNYDENGNMVVTKRKEYFMGSEVEIDPLTEADIAGITALISGDVTTDKINSRISAIITDESEAFFHGDIDADTASKNIQSRMDIYMSEQY